MYGFSTLSTLKLNSGIDMLWDEEPLDEPDDELELPSPEDLTNLADNVWSLATLLKVYELIFPTYTSSMYTSDIS